MRPGAGKTRLVAEHALTSAAGGFTVAYARGDEDDAAPFGLFVTVLAQLVDAAPAAVVEAHARDYGGELSRLVPALRARVPGLAEPRSADPDTERARLREAVVAFVRAVAVRTPTLLVLDDIHWADRSTLSLLLHLLRGPDAPLLVVATCREAPGDVGSPMRLLLPNLVREPVTTRLALDGLSAPDVIELVQTALESTGEVEAALGRVVHRETNGNALFATELVRQLAASDVAAADLARETAGTGALGVPAAIRDLVVQRLELLGPAAASTLIPATVVGLTFDAAIVARVLDRPDANILEALARARELALVFETGDAPGRFSFSHAVIHTALAQGLGSGQEQHLHERIAEELAALGATDAATLGEIARHRLASRDEDLARTAALRAGDAALALLAPHEAARWYREALARVPEARTRERCDVLIRLGEAGASTVPTRSRSGWSRRGASRSSCGTRIWRRAPRSPTTAACTAGRGSSMTSDSNCCSWPLPCRGTSTPAGAPCCSRPPAANSGPAIMTFAARSATRRSRWLAGLAMSAPLRRRSTVGRSRSRNRPRSASAWS